MFYTTTPREELGTEATKILFAEAERAQKEAEGNPEVLALNIRLGEEEGWFYSNSTGPDGIPTWRCDAEDLEDGRWMVSEPIPSSVIVEPYSPAGVIPDAISPDVPVYIPPGQATP